MTVHPPVAKQVPHVHNEHGVARPDPWHWIKDKTDPDTLPLLEAENAYVQEASAHLADLRKTLYDELLGRIQEDDTSVPVQDGDWWYTTRTETGKAYALHCRRQGGPDGPEQVVLDENALADGHDYFRTDAVEVSADHKRVAWLQDTSGAEHFTLFVKDLESGTITAVARDLKWSVAWAADGRHLFGTKADAAERPYQVWRYDLDGENAPALVYQDDDERFFVGVGRTRDWRYVEIESGSKTTSEVHLLDGYDATGTLRCVWPRRQDVLYDVVHHTGTLFIRCNDTGPNFRLVQVPADAPQTVPTELMAHDDDVYLTGVQSFRDHLVVWERRDGFPAIQIRDLAAGTSTAVTFPEPAYNVSPEQNPSFDTTTLRFTYASPRTPPTVVAYDMAAHTRTVLKVHPVIGYDADRYEVELLWATAGDGERIPVSLLRRKDVTRHGGPHPLYQIGYGSYGFSYPASFRSSLISLVDRGVVVCLAHIRGGAERGRRWYENGKLANKPNSFTDFVSVSEHLIREGWTAPDRLAIQGGSAGGLLMGAVINLRPDLYRACVADVAFVDALNTMLDDTLPLTVTEYEEWGNPQERDVFDRMLTYSPYDNVRAAPYPHVYATAGLNDPRVGYWEPAKWVQSLRAHSTSGNPVLFRVHLGAGHGGQSGRYGQLEDLSWAYSFVLDRLGVVEAA